MIHSYTTILPKCELRQLIPKMPVQLLNVQGIKELF